MSHLFSKLESITLKLLHKICNSLSVILFFNKSRFRGLFMKISKNYKFYSLIQQIITFLFIITLLFVLYKINIIKTNFVLYSLFIIVFIFSLLDFLFFLIRIKTIFFTMNDKFVRYEIGIAFKKIKYIPINQIYLIKSISNPILSKYNMINLEIKTLDNNLMVKGLSKKNGEYIIEKIYNIIGDDNIAKKF